MSRRASNSKSACCALAVGCALGGGTILSCAGRSNSEAPASSVVVVEPSAPRESSLSAEGPTSLEPVDEPAEPADDGEPFGMDGPVLSAPAGSGAPRRLSRGSPGLPPEVVQHVVRSHYDRLRRCYEASLQRDPNRAGSIRARFVIDAVGTVSSVDMSQSQFPDGTALHCFEQVFWGMKFPAPSAGTVTVVYPIAFTVGTGAP